MKPKVIHLDEMNYPGLKAQSHQGKTIIEMDLNRGPIMKMINNVEKAIVGNTDYQDTIGSTLKKPKTVS